MYKDFHESKTPYDFSLPDNSALLSEPEKQNNPRLTDYYI